MGNIGINNQYTAVSKPSVVRLKMSRGVDNGAGAAPSVQFGTTEGGCPVGMKPFTAYDLPKPAQGGQQTAGMPGADLAKFGGLNAAGGVQLGNKAVFNLYEMVSLMITLGNSLNKTFREQMAARVVGEISKLHDEARTLTNAAHTARTMGIASAAAGGVMGAMSLGGTLATGAAAKDAKAASGIDAASSALEKANLDMKPLQDFTTAQGGLGSGNAEKLNQMFSDMFSDSEGLKMADEAAVDIPAQLEQKTRDILAFEDNEKTIGELERKLKADDALKGASNKNNINNVNNNEQPVPGEQKGLSNAEREQISKDIESLKGKNDKLDEKYGIRKHYCNKVAEGGNDDVLRPSEVYRQELHERFEGAYRKADPNDDMIVLNGEDLKPKGFASAVDGEKSLRMHPFNRRAIKEAGAKWLKRQDAILSGGTEQVERNYSSAKMAFGSAQDVFKFKMENSRAVSFTQSVSGMGQGMVPVLQLLSGGAGVNELANAETKDLQAGERADSYNAGEMQAMKDGLKGIVDGALQVMSTAVSSYAQFQNTVNSNFRV